MHGTIKVKFQPHRVGTRQFRIGWDFSIAMSDQYLRVIHDKEFSVIKGMNVPFIARAYKLRYVMKPVLWIQFLLLWEKCISYDRYDMTWRDVTWRDMTWHDMQWHDVWYSMIWYMIYDMIWYDMIWYDMIWYDMIWYDMIWYDIWYDMMIYLTAIG